MAFLRVSVSHDHYHRIKSNKEAVAERKRTCDMSNVRHMKRSSRTQQSTRQPPQGHCKGFGIHMATASHDVI